MTKIIFKTASGRIVLGTHRLSKLYGAMDSMFISDCQECSPNPYVYSCEL